MGVALCDLHIRIQAPLLRGGGLHIFLKDPNMGEGHTRFLSLNLDVGATTADWLRMAQLLKEEVIMAAAKLDQRRIF